MLTCSKGLGFFFFDSSECWAQVNANRVEDAASLLFVTICVSHVDLGDAKGA